MFTYFYLFLLNLLIFFLDFEVSAFFLLFFLFFDNVFVSSIIFQTVWFC